MHTYRKVANDRFEIGMWLHTMEGSVFQKIFSVKLEDEALELINILNGGDGDLIPKIKKIERNHEGS